MFHIGSQLISPPYLLAPMAGVSEMPFRVIAKQMGAGLATTELVSAKGISFQNARSRQYLTFDPVHERPYSVQLFGGEERSMANAAAELVKLGADIIDINMGCPVKKVTKTGAGSALMCDFGRAADLVRGMRQAIGDAVPITAKIRLGWDENNINCVDMAKALEAAGCAAVAIHARTRAAGYSGVARWEFIGKVKRAVRIPVIGNGDVNSPADALRMREETGCDGVMIGRATLGNPWIFRALLKGDNSTPSLQERHAMVLAHLAAHIAFHQAVSDRPEMAVLRSIRSFRTHLVWYSRGLRNAGLFRESIMTVDDLSELQARIEQFFLNHEEEAEQDQTDLIDYRQAFG